MYIRSSLFVCFVKALWHFIEVDIFICPRCHKILFVSVFFYLYVASNFHLSLHTIRYVPYVHRFFCKATSNCIVCIWENSILAFGIKRYIILSKVTKIGAYVSLTLQSLSSMPNFNFKNQNSMITIHSEIFISFS